jgi:hypothetical protein
LVPSPIPEYNLQYAFDERRHPICSIYRINRDTLMEDLFAVLSK